MVRLYVGDVQSDHISPRVHFPQGPNVEVEVAQLMGVSEQIVTGQSSHPVVKLIQDAVVVAFCFGFMHPVFVVLGSQGAWDQNGLAHPPAARVTLSPGVASLNGRTTCSGYGALPIVR